MKEILWEKKKYYENRFTDYVNSSNTIFLYNGTISVVTPQWVVDPDPDPNWIRIPELYGSTQEKSRKN